MEKKYKILGITLGYVGSLIVSILLLSAYFPIINFIVIGSVTAVSAGSLYYVIESQPKSKEITLKRKSLPEPPQVVKKPIEAFKPIVKIKAETELLDDYLELLPYVQEYVDSEQMHEEFLLVSNVIFSKLEPDELEKIEKLDLTQIEKLEFIRDLLYFDTKERALLLDNMLEQQKSVTKEILYIPPSSRIKLGDRFRIHVISLVDPGEMKKIIVVDSVDTIENVKEDIGVLFDYNLDDFLLSSGGAILQEDLLISDYSLEDDDEIVLIPSKIPQK
ncbi:MAG: hypothetical protein JW891_15150 [Candidatus Lokiarchaeota archaeon]|nr:hypothetical protein [Candidatus Lokiarchaeota archaeon]